MDGNTAFESMANDSATVATFNTFNRFEEDRKPDDISSKMFKSSTSLSSVVLEEDSSSASFPRALRLNSKSAELKLLPKSSNIQMNNSILSELTINKFNIKSMGFIGREREIKLLTSCYERMTEGGKEHAPHDQSISTQSLAQSTVQKELVFINGYSGVGKSSLARTLEKEIQFTRKDGIYLEGKFDFNTSNEPYSGIASAFGDMCKRVSKRQDQSDKNTNPSVYSCSFGSRLSAALGPSANLMASFIPELYWILPTRSQSSVSSNGEHYDFELVQRRVKYAFRAMMRALNAEFSPVVLVLDDLQWADESSLEVMDSLISDLQNPNALMIVGCYRSNEVDYHSFLFQKVQSLLKRQDKFNFSIADIALGSYDVDGVNKMIMAMTSIDDEERTRGLAEVCFKRTAGNPFFLIEFMQMLQDEGLISYNLGLLKWVWDEKLIADATMSAANVVDLLQVRMRKMPADVQLLLQYAACLGSSFSGYALDLIWREQFVMRTDPTTDNVKNLLSMVVSSNFVEPCGENEYRWVHDKVREAALSLTDVVSPEFQFQIGTILYHSLNASDLEEQLFNVVDLINKERISSKQHEFAVLNLRAAEKAKKISAFQSAAVYVANGLDFLPSNKWSKHRTLTLALYTIGSEVELALGHGDSAETYSNEVLNRKECTTMEALPLKMAKGLKMCTVDLKYKETIEMDVGLLKELGIKLHWSRATAPLQAITTLMRTIKMAKKAPAPKDIFEKLGPMKDPKHRTTMLLLARLCYACYFDENIFLNVLSVCKVVEMTLKYGVCDVSSSGFAGLGLMALVVRKDYEAAAYFADIGLAMQNTIRGARKTETIYVSHVFCLAWSRPLQHSLAPTADGYDSGMRSGNTEFALWNLLFHHVWLPYAMGKRLGPILEQCPKLLSQMEELSQPEQAICLKVCWQTISNLTTTPALEDPLEGDIFRVGTFAGTSAVESMIHLCEGELLVFYDIEAAARRAIKDGDKLEKMSPGNFVIMFETFHRAIALFAMARRTKKRKYRTHANKLTRRIEGWMQSGNPNVVHYHKALMAEQAALNKKYDLAGKNYKNAIVLAAKTGHMHHAALINERYAEFLREELCDEQESKYRLGEAIRFYEEWGAFGKAGLLRRIL
eukprot:scaffold2923_cov121-Cylindrotheca_fusiformis.AAC.7